MTVVESQKRSLLRQHFLLGQLAPAELDRVLGMVTERQLKNGQVIFQKGDPGNSLMAVLHGRVKDWRLLGGWQGDHPQHR